jgi:hypothetical protein
MYRYLAYSLYATFVMRFFSRINGKFGACRITFRLVRHFLLCETDDPRSRGPKLVQAYSAKIFSLEIRKV